MIQDDTGLSLFDVSTRLGVSPSAIKKRVAHLNLPVQRGARGKLIFDRQAFNLLMQADEMLKAGHGFDECRRRLGLIAPTRSPVIVLGPSLDEATEVVSELAVEVSMPLPVMPSPVTPPPQAPEVTAAAPATPAAEASPVSSSTDDPRLRKLQPPVFIQLGRSRKPAGLSPDLVARLDDALRLIEDKERHNQMLQSKLLVAYDEMTKLSATAAAFQERSFNLTHEVQKLQGQLKMIEAPARARPWWKFWG